MTFFSQIWNGLQDGLSAILHMYANLLDPIAGGYKWGFSIILLTLTVRLFLVPLAVRQTKSMRSMQKLQPELKKLQKKYDVDKTLMKTDPEKYKAAKEKQREAQMALYQEHNVNPVGGCLPLVLQMPIFFALFQVLQPSPVGALDRIFIDVSERIGVALTFGDRIPELTTANFFGIDSLANTAAGGAGIGAIALVALQVGTTYYSTKMMQGRNSQAAAEQQQAQKLMLYIMPVFLGWLSWTFPIGVVLYWVTTNVWTIGQQWVIFRQVEAQEARDEEARAEARKERARARANKNQSGGTTAKKKPSDSASNGRSTDGTANGRASKGGTGKARTAKDAVNGSGDDTSASSDSEASNTNKGRRSKR
ncbi:YidC/Oxa1 family membrane protein insertase [Euzebya pacifica]|jgi:YidC/Oxa1 family membrane protein insertase|uniref:YidC/Oxa1 family membrane protein insertase n=1 Tax=Euzebya pacifica TaxID=1608957 RepID=UPI0030F53B96